MCELNDNTFSAVYFIQKFLSQIQGFQYLDFEKKMVVAQVSFKVSINIHSFYKFLHDKFAIGDIEPSSISNNGVVFCSIILENNSFSTVRFPLVTIGSPKLESKLAQPVSSLGSKALSPQGLEGDELLQTKQ